jgi:hypothetical protein
VTATGTIATYEWSKDGGPYSAAVDEGGGKYSLTITGVAAANAGSYQFRLDDGTATGCPIAISNPAVLTVNQIPTVNAVSDQTVCNGTNSSIISFSGTGTTYNWTNDNTTIGLAASGSGTSIAAFAATNTGTSPLIANIMVTPAYTNAGKTCYGTPIAFTITVNPTATVNAVSNQILCKGTITSVTTFSSPQTGGTITYSWANSNTAIGLAANGTGNLPSFTTTNGTNAPISATITVTPSYTNAGKTCAGTATTFTITVNPTPTVNAVANQTVCNGTNTTTVNFASAQTGGTITYSWTNDNTSIGLGASGSGPIAAFSAVNTGTTNQVATITVTPSYTNLSGGPGCTGTSTSFTITVTPNATVSAAGADQTICGTSTNLAANSPLVGTGAWTVLSTTGATAGATWAIQPAIRPA